MNPSHRAFLNIRPDDISSHKPHESFAKPTSVHAITIWTGLRPADRFLPVQRDGASTFVLVNEHEWHQDLVETLFEAVHHIHSFVEHGNEVKNVRVFAANDKDLLEVFVKDCADG